METKRVYTKSTPLLVELHKKHGTMGSNIEGCYFDNTDGYDNTGEFASSSCFKNYYIDRGYTELTEQEFIDFMEFPTEKEVFNPQQHYINDPKTFRSLFELSHILELNEWEFDILKRLVRCRKKGQFKEDLQKIKDTIDIYLNEYN